MNFRDAERYLYSLGNEVEAMKLGLENIRTLLAALGDPQENFLKVQVAGTNGKGSVCAFLNSICLEAGIKTGVYTSPHLISITERVRIAGEDITEDSFARYADRIRETAETLVANGQLSHIPTYFEQVTAIALLAFADAKVDVAILETGLGGRLDATTAANAEIAAITRIDLDHQEYLGETIEEIAAEKAAIIHSRSKVIVGGQEPEAMAVIVDRCRGVEIEPSMADRVRTTCDTGWLNFRSAQTEYLVDSLGLPGNHQIENAKVAIQLAELLQQYFTISREHIITGLKNACHPGRLEYSGRYLFDGAHNIGGARALREYLDKFISQPITMIFGSMRDKDVGEIAEILFPAVENIILTQPDNSRAMRSDEIGDAAKNLIDHDRYFLTDNVAEAIANANEIASVDSIILVTGSLYLVGEVKRFLSSQI